MTLDDVRAWNAAIIRYGSAEDRQSVSWSLDFLRASCSKQLQLKVEEKFDALERDERGGVIYFYLMMTFIMNMTDDVAR